MGVPAVLLGLVVTLFGALKNKEKGGALLAMLYCLTLALHLLFLALIVPGRL